MVKNKLPNVLVLATTFPRWKNDSEPAFVYNLSKGLAKKGFKIIALVPGAPGALSYEEMEGLKVCRFSYFYPKKLQKVCYDGGALPNLKNSWLAKIELPFFLFFQFIHIGWIIKREKIDMIHCHWIVPQGFFCAIFQRIFRIPLILTAHAGDVFSLNNPILRKIGKFTISQSSSCIANSNATQQAVSAISDGKIPVKIIPMGVDLDVFNEKHYNQNLKKKYAVNGSLLLAVGRFVEKKGLEYLIKAMPLVLKNYPETKLLIVGFGPMGQALSKLAAELHVEGSVIFPGKMSSPELAEYFASSDIVVGPSIVTDSGDTEGLGVVFIEALASNTAVIASRVGGITDLIIDNETGLLVNQKDPEDLAQKIMRLLGDKELRKELAAKGKKYVDDNFSWRNITEQYFLIYSQVLDK